MLRHSHASGQHCGLGRPDSLPTLKDWDTRRGPPGLRAAVLQREFEALGGSPGSHHRVRVEIGEEDGHSPQAPSKSPSRQPPSALCHLPLQAPLSSRFGSLVNVLELHIAEAQANRAATPEHGNSDHGLDISSRLVSESCLLALRQLAGVTSPKLGPVLQRIADALEPCLFSQTHRDAIGHRLSYEQVAKLVLQPQLADAAERTEDAEAARVRTLGQLDLEEAMAISLRRSLEEHRVALRKLQRQYEALQVRAETDQREAKAELDAQLAACQLEHLAESAALHAELERLRESHVDVSRVDIEGSEMNSEMNYEGVDASAALAMRHFGELVVAQALADAAKADLRASAAGRIRAVIALARSLKKVEKLEAEVLRLRARVCQRNCTKTE